MDRWMDGWMKLCALAGTKKAWVDVNQPLQCTVAGNSFIFVWKMHSMEIIFLAPIWGISIHEACGSETSTIAETSSYTMWVVLLVTHGESASCFKQLQMI